jgi:hypothetical protein
MPKQYVMEEEELDEFVVNGDDEALLDIDPECLPKMVRILPHLTERMHLLAAPYAQPAVGFVRAYQHLAMCYRMMVSAWCLCQCASINLGKEYVV